MLLLTMPVVDDQCVLAVIVISLVADHCPVGRALQLGARVHITYVAAEQSSPVQVIYQEIPIKAWRLIKEIFKG